MTPTSRPHAFTFREHLKRWAILVGLLAATACQVPQALPPPVQAVTPKPLAYIVVGSDIPEADDLASTLRPYRAELEAQFSKVLVQCPQGINRAKPHVPMGQWVTDTMRARASLVLGTPVALAVTNTGGLRVDFPAGPITLRHIYEVFPFENTLVVGELRGNELIRFAMELAETGEPFSGLSIKVSGPQGAARFDGLTLVGGEPIDPTKIYLITSTEYLVSNGDRTPTLKTLRNVRKLNLTVRQMAIDAVEALGREGKPLAQVVEPRLVRPADWTNRRTKPLAGER